MAGGPRGEDAGTAAALTEERAALRAARALLRAGTEQEVTSIVLGTVEALGGRAEPVSSGRERTIPIDLTLGTREPLLPAGSPEVLARLRDVMPSVVEDARVALDRIRRDAHLQQSAWADVLTGLVSRSRLEEVAERLGPGDTIALLRLDGVEQAEEELGHDGAEALVGSFCRSLRRHVHAADTVGRLGPTAFGVLMLRTPVEDAVEVIGGLRARWAASRSRQLQLTSALAAVLDHKPARVLLALERCLDSEPGPGQDHVLEVDPA